MLPRLLTRCRVLSKPGLGALHLHAAVWRPGRVREILFEPESRAVMHVVPEAQWEAVLTADSFEQAMSLIRQN